MSMTRARLAAAATTVAAATALMTSPAAAHVHTVNGHPIANGQHHPIYTSIGDGQGTSCDTSLGPGGAEVGPAWYGLETAHHGPDTGSPGRGDGCYQTAVVQLPSGAWVPAEDANPAID